MNNQYQRPIQDDVSEISRYTTPPTSPLSQAIDRNIARIDTMKLDSLITSNIKNHQNQSTSKIDNIDNMFEDLLSISDTTSQKRNSASSATSSNYIIETSKNKAINLTSNIIENMKQKEADLIKIDLDQFEFSYPTKPQSSIKSNELGDMAFLYRINKNIVSVCFNRMQYEAAIPLNQLTGFCITDNGKIFIKLKKNYQHYFGHHLGGYPYLLEPAPMNYDPTGNKFDRAQSLLLTPHPTERLPTLSSLGSKIERLYFCKNGIHNEANTEDGLKIYITCVFPHERRAIALPVNAPFHELLAVIENRFGKTSIPRYGKNKEWIEVNNDESWTIVKDQAIGKRLLRLELHIW
ncbi:hypothetical protein RclHR1_07070012 [Rhizophagus clarus]|uniref:PB1 domain-containing protein n=1 Tax=Rhizophagus clarus TaxID=94130 RepID=A0A2Z6SAU4_9GLOM|nr:hypothetical protein RclHR1_07070012 [Rhizophagus clarus]GES78487.1 hypothetical protein GLOIN_2v1656753 [Rhizophagus clarus]